MQWNCRDCGQIFASKTDFLDHRERQHSGSASNRQTSVLLDMCSQPADDKGFGKCGLCFKENQPLLKHMAHHMLSLALFVLPRRDDDTFELDDSDKCEVGVSGEDSAIEDGPDTFSVSDVMSEISDVAWEEVITEKDSDTEGSSPMLATQQTLMQVSQDRPNIIEPQADDFWDRAYHVSKGQGVWTNYEEILKKELGDAATAEISFANNLQRGSLMSSLVLKKAEFLDKSEWNLKLDRSYETREIVRTVLFAKDCILSGKTRGPSDAMAWVGICLLLPAVLSGVYTEGYADLFDDAGIEEAIPYIAILIHRLNIIQSIYREQRFDSPNPSSESQIPFRRSFEIQMTNLCAQILKYQAQAVYHCLEKEMSADESPLPGQISELKKSDTACRESFGIIDQSKFDNTLKLSNIRMDEVLRLQRKTWEAQTIGSKRKKQRSVLQTTRDDERSLNACLEALMSIDYKSEKSRNRDRIPGTCQWFLGHQDYHDWIAKRSSNVLYLTGDPGCGKSVLMKSLIDGELQSTDSITTCYFFFRDDGSGSGSSINALLALIHQLCSQSRVLLREADQAIRRNRNKIDRSFPWLLELFRSLIQHSEARKIICVLDALDECEEAGGKRLVTSLNELALDVKDHVLFLLTSRPNFEIGHSIEANGLRMFIDDHRKAVQQEINSIIQGYVPRLAAEKALDFEIQTALQSRLLETQNSSQLWLHLTLAAVEEAAGVNGSKGMARFIESLPRTFNEAYRVLLRLSPQPEQASKLLHIVVAAVRPLTLREVIKALNVEDTNKSREEIPLLSETDFKKYIDNLCGSMVNVYHGKVLLAHQTVKQWWSSKKPLVPLHRQLDTPSKENVLSSEPVESHRVLARICLIYLASDVLEDDLLPINSAEDSTRHEIGLEYEDRRRQILKYAESQDLMNYAALHWTHHFQAVGERDLEMFRRWMRICQPQSERFDTWFQVYWYARRMRNSLESNGMIPNFSKMSLASFLGQYLMVDHLIGRGEPLERKAGQGWSPLTSAIHSRNAAIISLLIENGTSVASEAVEDWTPLGLAASKGYEGILGSLLQHGADIEQQTYRRGITALGKACEAGREEIVEILLKSGARTSTRYNDGSTALMVAAKQGRLSVAKKLIHHGADIGASTYLGMTALLYATRGGHQDLAQMLLDRGADVDVNDEDGRTPLSWAAQHGLENIVKILLPRASLFDSRDDDGLTPLFYATDSDHREVALILLNSGADVDATDKQGQTSLSHAVNNGYPHMAQLLLKGGANSERRDERGLTALLHAAIHGRTKIIQYLLESGADANAIDEAGQTPIMYALQCLFPSGRVGNVSILLTAGAETNTIDKQGRTALSYAASDRAVVRLLLESGANPNIVDSRGRAPLHYAVLAGADDSSKYLISAGADVTLRDEEGTTPLELARRLRNEDILLFMEQNLRTLDDT